VVVLQLSLGFFYGGPDGILDILVGNVCSGFWTGDALSYRWSSGWSGIFEACNTGCRRILRLRLDGSGRRKECGIVLGGCTSPWVLVSEGGHKVLGEYRM